MDEKILIEGYCPEIARGGYFPLEKILDISPRILKMKGGHPMDVGKFERIERGWIFRNSYTVHTPNNQIKLDFYKKNERNEIFLGLPREYGFGKEIFEGK